MVLDLCQTPSALHPISTATEGAGVEDATRQVSWTPSGHQAELVCQHGHYAQKTAEQKVLFETLKPVPEVFLVQLLQTRLTHAAFDGDAP